VVDEEGGWEGEKEGREGGRRNATYASKRKRGEDS
jgi:hypothetical protein